MCYETIFAKINSKYRATNKKNELLIVSNNQY